MMKKVLDEQTNRNVPIVTINLPNEGSYCSIKTSMISLPYKGKQGENVICSLRNTLDKILPQDVFFFFFFYNNRKPFRTFNEC